MTGLFVRWIIASALVAVSLGIIPLARASQIDRAKPWEPTDPVALKTYQAALQQLSMGKREEAITGFRKAALQDRRCIDCLRQAYSLASRIAHYKEAEDIAREWVKMATTNLEKAAAHYRVGMALQNLGIQSKKAKYFDESCREFYEALKLEPDLAAVHYDLGVSLAHLHQDDTARTEFSYFLKSDASMPDEHERAQRFLDHIDLARARMAPPFSVTTIDGQRISLDSLAGNVVLIDFWAMWCPPCIEGLPHLREIVHRFQNQPFVVISISLDPDKAKWKDFVAKNQMTWPQYRDSSVNGPVATAFGITAIPASFTIDADGVLEDQHVGDGNIEGKLKKLIASANAKRKPATPGFQDRQSTDRPGTDRPASVATDKASDVPR
jgi:peroxiredoxin